ncbi:hypothetical protein J7L67_05690 [bacterium]|nr:hypothetical protein [bacterium]
MLMCFNCSQEIKAIMDGFIKSGQYNDYSQLVNCALENLKILYNEFETDNKNPLVFHGLRRIQNLSTISNNVKKEIPDIFKKKSMKMLPNAPAYKTKINRGNIGLGKWILGQYNTFLPVKASCRALVCLLKNNKKGLNLNEAAIVIADKAAQLGDYLSDHDRSHRLLKENAVSTGFPSNAQGNEKSKIRYAKHFVGQIKPLNKISGLLFDLKLINIIDHKKSLVALTQYGYRFANMDNPILDETQDFPEQKFSEEEIDFLLAHIKYSIPVEYCAHITILGHIFNGANTPNSLDKALSSLVHPQLLRKTSKSYWYSQRSGAVSRMTDLELIERERHGTKFFYKIKDRAMAILKK